MGNLLVKIKNMHSFVLVYTEHTAVTLKDAAVSAVSGGAIRKLPQLPVLFLVVM